jgi:hypothetical protein
MYLAITRGPLGVPSAIDLCEIEALGVPSSHPFILPKPIYVYVINNIREIFFISADTNGTKATRLLVGHHIFKGQNL